jgi:hypothetical protein
VVWEWSVCVSEILMASLCVGVVSWFLSVAELIGMWWFWPRLFRAGICVLRKTQMLPSPADQFVGSELVTSNGKILVVNAGLCLFRSMMPWLTFSTWTPFQIKGSLKWNGSQTTVEGRIPVFATLYHSAFLVGWTVNCVMVAVKPGTLLLGVLALLVGWGFLAALCFFSIRLEIRRAKEIVREFQEFVANDS